MPPHQGHALRNPGPGTFAPKSRSLVTNQTAAPDAWRNLMLDGTSLPTRQDVVTRGRDEKVPGQAQARTAGCDHLHRRMLSVAPRGPGYRSKNQRWSERCASVTAPFLPAGAGRDLSRPRRRGWAAGAGGCRARRRRPRSGRRGPVPTRPGGQPPARPRRRSRRRQFPGRFSRLAGPLRNDGPLHSCWDSCHNLHIGSGPDGV